MSKKQDWKIYYKGLEQLADIVDDTTETVLYKHIYRSTFMDTSGGTHACFEHGHFCWKQAREEPLKAIKYLYLLKPKKNK